MSRVWLFKLLVLAFSCGLYEKGFAFECRISSSAIDCTNGTSCTIVGTGPITFCDNGIVCEQIGFRSQCSNSINCYTSGAVTECMNGQRCEQADRALSCEGGDGTFLPPPVQRL